MKHLKRLGTCLVVISAVSAASATAASAALPEFVPAAPVPFKSGMKVTTFETSITKVKIVCTSGTDEGQITSPNSVSITVKLMGCKNGEIPCKSPNGVSGEIQLVSLSGTLGYIKKPATTEVGLDLASPAGALVTDFTCGAVSVSVRGSVIGRITPINKVVTPKNHFTVKFAQIKGHQKVTHFEGGPPDILEASVGGGPLEAAGLTTADFLTFAAPLEVKA